MTIHAVEEAVVDVDELQKRPPYLVTECVVGQSLQQKQDRSGSLSLNETLRISRQIAEGLAAAHRQGLVHRDIKPANILLENGVERVKITDFGLARAIDDITVTRTGELSGTPQYMSPEQASGERVDHRSDLFSLGCVMYAMCTGHSPFRADSLAHVIKRVTQDVPRCISEQNPEVPRWLIDIIDRLLRKEPGQRFQQTEEVVATLDQHLARLQQPARSDSHSLINQQITAIGSRPTEAASVSADDQTQPGPIRRKVVRGLLSVGVVLVLCGLGGLLLLITDPVLFDAIPLIDRNIHKLIISGLGAGLVLLIVGVVLRGDRQREGSGALLAFYIMLGPLGILLWLVDKEQRDNRRLREQADERAAVATRASLGSESPTIDASGESIHGCVGSWLILCGVFSAVLPPMLIAMGPIIQDGDIMELGGSMLIVALPIGLIAVALGYVLRYIIDARQHQHRRLRLGIPVAAAVVIAVPGGLYQWTAERAQDDPDVPVRARSTLEGSPFGISEDGASIPRGS